jgi:molecular chaperone DnaK (HSP70)
MTFDGPSFISGLSGVVTGVVPLAFWLRNMFGEMSDLRKEVKDLKDNRIGKLERKVEQHLSADNSQAVAVDLKHISAQLQGISAEIRLTREDVAALKAQRSADLHYLENVNQALQDHKRQGHHA